MGDALRGPRDPAGAMVGSIAPSAGPDRRARCWCPVTLTAGHGRELLDGLAQLDPAPERVRRAAAGLYHRHHRRGTVASLVEERSLDPRVGIDGAALVRGSRLRFHAPGVALELVVERVGAATPCSVSARLEPPSAARGWLRTPTREVELVVDGDILAPVILAPGPCSLEVELRGDEGRRRVTTEWVLV